MITNLKYKFGKRVFEIQTQYSFFYEYAKEYQTFEDSDYNIEISKEDIAEFKLRNKEEAKDEVIEALVILEKISFYLAESSTFLMHGSAFYIDNTNNGFIITAPSGVGKSTHARILKQYLLNRFTYVNDDKPFISYESNFYIYGSPYDGKDRLSNNVRAKLKAIFILERGNNSIRKLTNVEAISYLAKQIHIPKGLFTSAIVTDLMILMLNKIPTYLLSVDMSNEAKDTSLSIINQYLE